MAAAQGPPPVEDGPWAKGTDSYLEPTQVAKGYYRWSVNASNRGGTVRTRPGFSAIPVRIHTGTDAPDIEPPTDGTDGGTEPLPPDVNEPPPDNILPPPDITEQSLLDDPDVPDLPDVIVAPTGMPRGLTVFDDAQGIPQMVVAIGQRIYYCPFPFTAAFTMVNALRFEGQGPVCFTRCIVGVTEAADGTLTNIDPYPILMIQDGASRAGYWKGGQNARHLDPAKPKPFGGPSETPSGLWSAWSGNRYWVSNGTRVRASNLLNPIKFTEEDLLEEGGFLTFPGMITGMTNTFDFTSLLVYTHKNTSTLISSLLDRTQWGITPGFQKVIFEGIGCVGGNAITTQWGMVWWYAHEGLMSLDEGLRAFQSSKITFRDREMSWSKGNISAGFVGNIALGAFENLLFVSVPSGDKYNAHTWAMDEAPLDTLTYWGFFGLPSWSGIWEGIRPVAWFTASVKGQSRTFCLSADYPRDDDPTQTVGANVWEMVSETRMDLSFTPNFGPLIQPISCSLETKLLGYDGNYKFFRLAEIYLDNVEGEVDLKVSYAPRRGGYKVVLEKHIVSSDWLMQNPTTQIPVDTFLFDPMRPQQRVVRTISEAKTYTSVPNSGDDAYAGVQTSANVPFPRQKDYAFSVLLEWTGRLSISNVRAYFDPEEQETEGVDELDETTDRMVDMAGINKIDSALTPYKIDPLSMNFKSHVLTPTSAIWIDPVFQSIS